MPNPTARRSSLTLLAIVAPLTALVVVGCGGDTARTPAATVRDSAGINIVENTDPAWPPGEGWRLEAESVLAIGVAQGPEEYALYQVRGALWLATGEIVVANAGTNELRFYDSTGAFLRTVGGEGGGPGEYQRMFSLWRLGTDSLLVYELGDRATVLGADGTFARSFTLDRATLGGYPSLVGPFADGSLLARVWRMSEADAFREGWRMDQYIYARYSRTGETADSLITRPGGETVTSSTGGGISSGPPPFGRRAVTAIGGDRWYYGYPERFEIEVYAPDGRLERLIRRAVDNPPVTEEVAEYRRRQLMEGSVPEAFRQRQLERPLPRTLPAFGAECARSRIVPQVF